MESTSYSKIPADVKSTLGSEVKSIDFTLSGTILLLLKEHIGLQEGNWTISDGKHL